MAQLILTNGVAPSTPAAGTVSVYTKTADKKLYYLDELGAEQGPLAAGGTGTVTHTAGNLTANAIVLGNAVADITVMGSLGTTTTILHGNAAGAPTWSAVSLTADITGILAGTNGGTGVNNGSNTITLGGNLTTSGAFATTITSTATTNATLPAGTNNIGYLEIPQNSKSAAYTTVLTDSGKHLLHPSADTTARIFTIDSNANVAYPIGTAITFVNQNSAGVMTIAITTDTMRLAGAGTTGSRTLAANGIATALKLTSTEWIISGTGLT